jgi:hypothetical protein
MEKLGWLVVILVVGAVVWVGSKLGSANDPPAAAAPAPALTTTTAAPDPGTTSTSRRRHSHEPREHHDARDQTIALDAVLHPEDVESGIWHKTEASNETHPCPQNDPDLSSLTVTACAHRTYLTSNKLGAIDSIVRVFPDRRQARHYFEAVNNRGELGCLVKSVRKFLAPAGARMRLLYARLQDRPALGDRTAVYLVAYELTFPNGASEGYPVELLRFQRGRANATLYYSSVFSRDGSRPCTCELDDARRVSKRLAAT